MKGEQGSVAGPQSRERHSTWNWATTIQGKARAPQLVAGHGGYRRVFRGRSSRPGVAFWHCPLHPPEPVTQQIQLSAVVWTLETQQWTRPGNPSPRGACFLVGREGSKQTHVEPLCTDKPCRRETWGTRAVHLWSQMAGGSRGLCLYRATKRHSLKDPWSHKRLGLPQRTPSRHPKCVPVAGEWREGRPERRCQYLSGDTEPRASSRVRTLSLLCPNQPRLSKGLKET